MTLNWVVIVTFSDKTQSVDKLADTNLDMNQAHASTLNTKSP